MPKGGYKQTEKHKQKLRDAKKRNPTWNKGIHYHTKESKEHLRKMNLGNQYAKGHKMSEENKQKIRQANTERVPWNKGKKMSKELCEKNSKAHIGLQAGENNPRWRGGRSYEPYPIEFNEALKERIRKRDNYFCQICGEIENDGRELNVHHIDYDKNNNNESNLVSLCSRCHSITNNNRDYWIEYFKEVMLV